MSAQQKRQYALYAVAVALVIWAWYVVLHDPIYQVALRRILPFPAAPPSISLPDGGIYEAKDPSIGTPFPKTG
ncbi:MAG TPA: hypothetical protein VNJ09_03205, partial [Chthonomonadales bacterium]|nr:hypothetical protein [Chthonomonadales bacterium]